MRCPACAARSTRSRVPAAWSGATDIAEFAWAIENLLNKIIENTLQRSPAILATVRDATGAGRRAGECARSRSAPRRPGARPSSIARTRWPPTRRDPSAQTATMEILERTLETRRDDVIDATGRVPTLQAAPEPRGRRPTSSRPSQSRHRMLVHRSRGGLGVERPGRGGENIVLSSPEEEPQRRPAASRNLQPRNPGEHRRGIALRRGRAHAQRAARW